MFPDNISQNIDILVVMNVWKNNFGFHSNQKTQGQKHRVNNLYFKYQVCQMKLRHLNTFLQFRLLFHEPHCTNWRLILDWASWCWQILNFFLFVRQLNVSCQLSLECPYLDWENISRSAKSNRCKTYNDCISFLPPLSRYSFQSKSH